MKRRILVTGAAGFIGFHLSRRLIDLGDVGFRPSTPIEVGLEKFVKWHREYYGV